MKTIIKETIKDIKENYQMLVPAAIVLTYIVTLIVIGTFESINIIL